MPRAWRMYLGPHKGRINQNFNVPGVINSRSVVMISACEYVPDPPGEHFAHSDHRRRFRGAANVWVSSIAPHGPSGSDPGGVEFAINIDWPDPIPVVFDIAVFDPPEDIEP
jgi:hypothetical protein